MSNITQSHLVLSFVLGLLGTSAAQHATPPQPKSAPKSEGQKLLEQLRQQRPQPLVPKPVSFVVLPDDTIFPSLTIAEATIGFGPLQRSEFVLGDGLYMSAIVRAPFDNAQVQVTISCDSVMEPSTYAGFLKNGGKDYEVKPKLRWKWDELLKVHQQVPVNLVCKVKVGNLPEVEEVRTCTLRALNDCPIGFVAGGVHIDTQYAFAAYVNEDHPWVQDILREALGTRVITAFTGYQRNDPDEVLRQIYAVWRVFQVRGISYSDVARVSAQQGDTIASQHVRFLDQSIEQKQANCVDGTVMFASVLRKFGLNPYIVGVPGHMFLAVDLDPDGQTCIGLETTILGKARKEDFDRAEKLGAQLQATTGFETASWDSFVAALKVGTDRLQLEMPKLTDPAQRAQGYLLIDLAAARQLGVRPIAYKPVEPKPAESKPRDLRRVR